VSALVLGVGNVLLSDEGIGIRIVEELEHRYRFPEEVEILDGGTSGIELLRFFDGRDHLIIIDAVRADHPPGTVVRVEGAEVPATFETRITPHQLGLSDLLATAKLTDQMPAYLVLFGIEPKSLETGLGFSPEVEASVEKVVIHVAEELRRLGYNLEECPDRGACKSRFWGAGEEREG
jgi:hydrogenase maturation protease